MKRRRFFQALAAIPAAAPLAAQQGGGRGAAAPPEDTKLEVSVPESAADGVLRFFTPPQFAALRRVSDILVPAATGTPGALSTEAPEFLDFLIGKSGPDRQLLYRAGLDGLNAQARKQFNKSFAELETAQAETLLTPLRNPWTYQEPADPVARFLRSAKNDVRTATSNSRTAAAGRRFAGSGLYWYPLD